jgi:uncharacterized protein YodC (DUF2158 family)
MIPLWLHITSWFYVAAVAAFWAIVPQGDGVLRDRCDCVEVNHLFDENGREVFTQAIWIDLVDGIERIVAWRLVKDRQPLPVRDWQGGGYLCRWSDGESVREVRTNCVRETWTQSYDPELAARELYPKEKRRELRRAGK